MECRFVFVNFNVKYARERVIGSRSLIYFHKILDVSFLREREFPRYFISFNKGFIERIMFSCFIYHSAISHPNSSVMSIISYVLFKTFKAGRIPKVVKRADDKVMCDDVIK